MNPSLVRVCLIAAVVGLLAVALWAPRRSRRAVVVGSESPPPNLVLPAGPAFLATLTADDVARGVWGLSGSPTPLTEAQRATITPLLAEGASLRAATGALRERRRAGRRALIDDGLTIVETLGTSRTFEVLR